jgi:hypothetical protein
MAAGQQKLQIEISAVDRVTAQVNKINKSLDKLAAGPRRFQNSLKQFSDASGLTKFGSKLKNVGAAAARVGAQIKGAVERVAEIAGVGGAAALVGLTYEWSKLGLEVTRTSDRLGLTTTQLQEIRNVGIASGAGLEATSQAFETMGTTLEDATYGRNQSALVMMARLNIQLHRLKGGAVDAKEGMLQLADAIQAQGGNRQAQMLIANQFGAGALLPELLKGRAGMKAYFQMVEKYSMSPEQVKRADEFALKLNEGRLAADQLRNSIGNGLIPVFQPLIQQFIDWENIAGNRDKLVGAISSGVNWLIDKIPKLVTAIGDVVDALGGWKSVAIIFGASIAASVLAPIALLAASLASLGGSLGGPVFRMLGLLGMQFGYVGGAAGAMAAGLTSLGLLAGAGGAGGAAGMGFNWLYNKASGLLGGSGSLGSDIYDGVQAVTHGTDSGRRNNPGNLRTPGGKGFQAFASPQAGLDAMARQLEIYSQRDHINTLSGIVNKYSPAGDHNDPNTEIPQIAGWTGFGANDELDMKNPAVLAKVMTAIIRKEGNSAGVTAADVNSAAQQASTFHFKFSGLPKGVSVVAMSSNPGVKVTSTATDTP